MSDKPDAMRHQGISELITRCDLAKGTLNRLSEESKRIDSEMEKGSERLNALRRRLSINEREIKDSQSVIFHLNGKKKDMDDASSLLFKEIKSTEAELRWINSSKDALNIDIKNILSDIREVFEAVSSLKTEKRELSSSVDEMEAEKRRLSDEISRFLSKTSLERDKIEEVLNELSSYFFNSIAERDTLKLELSQLETATKDMIEVISELDEKIGLLQDVKALQSERGGLKTDIEERKWESVSLSARLEELQRMLAHKQEKAERLSTENAERRYSAESLEKEVMAYDKATTGLVSAQERLKSASKQAERDGDVLKKLLVDKGRLEQDLRMAMDKVTRTAHVMKSMD